MSMNRSGAKKIAIPVLVSIIVAAALFFRLWGLGWDRLYPRHHDERVHLEVTTAVLGGVFSPREIWTGRKERFAFYPWLTSYLAAGSIYAWNTAADGFFALLSDLDPRAEPGNGLQEGQRNLLIGRLMVALMGTATVWIVYRSGLLLWGHKVGLLSAALTALTGYHIANCHWFKNDIVCVFFMTAALYYSVRIFRRGRLLDYLAAAFFSALAIGAKFNVFPIVAVLPAAHFLRAGGGGKTAGGASLGKLTAAFLTLAAILAASYPVLYLEWDFTRAHLLSYLIDLPREHLAGSAPPRPFPASFLGNLVGFARFSWSMEIGMGWGMTLGVAAGLLLAGWKRDKRLLLSAVFPVIYIVAVSLLASPSIRYQETIPLYPFAALLAAAVLLFVLERLLKKRWMVGLAFPVASAVLLLPYLKSAVRMSYGYWLPDTYDFATWWAADNLPDGSVVARERHTLDLPDERFLQQASVYRLSGFTAEEYRDQGYDYLAISSRQMRRVISTYGPGHPHGRFYRSLEPTYRLVKRFSLGEIPYKRGDIYIYELARPAPLCPRGLNSDLLRAWRHDFSRDSSRIIFLGPEGEAGGETGFRVPPETRAERLVVSPQRLSKIGVKVTNGPHPGTIRISVGNKKIRADFLPHQTRQFEFPARTGFPWVHYSYRVKVSSIWNSECLVRILPDAFRMGLGCYRVGERGAARKHLAAAIEERPRDWPAYFLLAAVEDGEEAERIMRRFRKANPGFEKEVAPLLETGLTREEWRREFRRLSGYDMNWLEESAALRWDLSDLEPIRIDEDNETVVRRGSVLAVPPGKYQLRFSLPAGASLPSEIILRDGKRVLGGFRPAGRAAAEAGMTVALEEGLFSFDLVLPENEDVWPGKIFLYPSLRNYVERLLSRSTAP